MSMQVRTGAWFETSNDGWRYTARPEKNPYRDFYEIPEHIAAYDRREEYAAYGEDIADS